MGTLLALFLAVPILSIAALQVSVLPDGSVRVPIRGASGVPEVRPVSGGLLVEVPEGRVERGSATGTGEIESISTATSHSRHRALITLHLRQGSAVGPERVEATLGEGGLTVRVHPAKAAMVPTDAMGAAGNKTPAVVGRTFVKGVEPGPRIAMEARPVSALALRVGVALGLLGLAAWLAVRHRRVRGGEVRPAGIDIVATRLLGKSQRLMVVDVNQQRFLLAASDQGGIRLVAQIEGPAAMATAADPLKAIFADMLADVSKVAPKPRPALRLVPDEDITEPAPLQQSPGSQEVAAPTTPAKQGMSVPMTPPVSTSAGSGSSDVAGLMALRRNRTQASR